MRHPPVDSSGFFPGLIQPEGDAIITENIHTVINLSGDFGVVLLPYFGDN